MVLRSSAMVGAAAAGEDPLGGARRPSRGPEAGVEEQAQGVAHQVGGHLLDEPPRVEVTRRRGRPPAASTLLLLARARQLLTAMPLLGNVVGDRGELRLQETGDEVLGEGQGLRGSLLIRILGWKESSKLKSFVGRRVPVFLV